MRTDMPASPLPSSSSCPAIAVGSSRFTGSLRSRLELPSGWPSAPSGLSGDFLFRRQLYAANRVVVSERCDLEGNCSTTASVFLEAQTMHCGGSFGANDAARRFNVERIAVSTASL